MAEAAPPVKVLLAGASEVTFTEGDPALTMAALMQADLHGLRPGQRFLIEPHVMYQMANMRERCLRLAEALQPDLVVLWLSGNIFSEETVNNAIYHRARWLYSYADRGANTALSAAGGDAEGGSGLAGALFRLGRAAGRATFGRRALIPVEVAYQSTVETVEALRERWPVLCRLANWNARQADQAAAAQRRVHLYNDAVAKVCRRLGVPVMHSVQEIIDGGAEYVMGPDGLHADLATRRLNTAIGARHILKVLSDNGQSVAPTASADVVF